MFDELTKYKNNGHFFFERGQTLLKVCNAPAIRSLQLNRTKLHL